MLPFHSSFKLHQAGLHNIGVHGSAIMGLGWGRLCPRIPSNQPQPQHHPQLQTSPPTPKAHCVRTPAASNASRHQLSDTAGVQCSAGHGGVVLSRSKRHGHWWVRLKEEHSSPSALGERIPILDLHGTGEKRYPCRASQRINSAYLRMDVPNQYTQESRRFGTCKLCKY